MIALDWKTGGSEVLFDANPEFKSLRLGPVTRLHWKNDLGFECFGDLVLPFGHKPGTKLPLIVVQYRTRGFLRGGVGDEFPIQAFASRGYAVLSVENPPPSYEANPGPLGNSVEELQRAETVEWKGNLNAASSLLKGIDLLVDQGVADPARIGLTGLSNGSTSAQAAIVARPAFFAAASLAACCVEPGGMLIYGGVGLADERRRIGYPPAFGDGRAGWAPISIVLNAQKITTPILMQLNDRGYLLGLETYMALREYNRPTELYVFPDEYHVKWQPAHRLAAYERNLDWFDFWVRGSEGVNPIKAEQYIRWRALREKARGTAETHRSQ